MTVGQNIKKLRIERNLTQTKLSTRMGYTSNSVLSKLENDHMAPTITHLRRLSIALKVPQVVIMDVDGIYEEELVSKLVDLEKENVVEKNDTESVEDVKQETINTVVEEPIIENREYTFNEKTSNDYVVRDVIFKFRVKEHPFYHNVLLTIISFILILSPLLIFKFDSNKDMLYMLIASTSSILVLLGSLIINHFKKKQVNITVESLKEEIYQTKLTTKKLAVIKIFTILLSLGFLVTSYYYVINIKGLLTDDLLKYFLIGILALSFLVKLISSFMLRTKTKVSNINSSNTQLVVMFIIDVVVLVVLPMMLNINNINITKNTVIFLVSSQLISYLVLIFTNKYNSLFKFNL